MKCDVTVNFGGGRVLELQARYDDSDPQAPAAAHRWLQATYDSLGCEPIRPSGKVLLLDRIIAIAMTAGYDGLRDDPALAEGLARNTALAVGRMRITIDVPALTVGY